MSKALYVFSGDPITYGHIDIIKRACNVFGSLIVGIGTNPDKTYTFTAKERLQMAETALKGLPVMVVSMTGLTVDYALEQGIPVLVRGIRNTTDMEYEQVIDSINNSQSKIDTVAFFADPILSHVSSSAVKAIQKECGVLKDYVPPAIKQAMERKANQIFVGITGGIASGKSKLADALVTIGNAHGIAIHNIDFDVISQDVLELPDPLYENLRSMIIDKWPEVSVDNKIDRKKLGDIVFKDVHAMDTLNDFMTEPCMTRFRRKIHDKQGIILINAAYLLEYDMLHLCNYNAVAVTCSLHTQYKRVGGRGYDPAQQGRRIDTQHSSTTRLALMNEANKTYGCTWEFKSEDDTDYLGKVNNLFSDIKQHFGVF